MSYTEYWLGKLIEITMPKNLTFEEEIKFLKSQGHFFGENDVDVELEDEWFCSETCIKLLDKYYKIEAKDLKNDSLGKITKNEKGELEFYTTFYNGGCCLKESLEYLLKEHIKENKKIKDMDKTDEIS